MQNERLGRGFGALRYSNRFSRSGILASTVFFVAALLVTPVRAEYRVDVGDVIEISVAKMPELQRRVIVQPDGSISVPMLGTLSVAGFSPAEVQAKIQSTIASRVFRQRTPDGLETPVVIGPDELSASIVEYRPVYVDGDVSKPGEHPYRPRMTVRQAVALSGGYDVLRGKVAAPVVDPADLTSESTTLWIEIAKEQAHVWRIKAELANTDNIDSASLMDVPIAGTTLSQIVSVETEQLKSAQESFQHEKEFLLRSIKQIGEQIAVLTEQQQKEEQGTQADVEELQRASDLFAKGALPSPRVTDARRAVLLSATRKLQTMAQLMQERRQQGDLTRQIEKLEDQRRADLLRELQDADVRVSEIRARLQGIGMKRHNMGAAKSQLMRGQEAKPELTIHRIGERSWERFKAQEDSELQPGDVVEVVLLFERTAEMNFPDPTVWLPVAAATASATQDDAHGNRPASPMAAGLDAH
jgi:polysaccharide export outer membrane protein